MISKPSNRLKFTLITAAAVLTLVIAAVLGSVSISPADMWSVILHKLNIHGSLPLPSDSVISVFWTIRIPRVLLSFLVGGILAICGVVTQSILQNPLASSYTLGVSSGAALGAAIITVMEISVPMLGVFLLPVGGFVGAGITVALVLVLSSRFTGGQSSYAVVLLGMVISLFANSILTLLSVLSADHRNKLLSWQMGSFAGKRGYHVIILLVFAVLGLIILITRNRELDILSFGEETAQGIGVDAGRERLLLLIISSILTGVSVCFTGTIGFVDLIAPHLTRRIFGPAHKALLPASFMLGGILLCLSDLLARTILAPIELPVGAVTALFGAPFFLWVFLSKRK